MQCMLTSTAGPISTPHLRSSLALVIPEGRGRIDERMTSIQPGRDMSGSSGDLAVHGNEPGFAFENGLAIADRNQCRGFAPSSIRAPTGYCRDCCSSDRAWACGSCVLLLLGLAGPLLPLPKLYNPFGGPNPLPAPPTFTAPPRICSITRS